ncbi:MAG: AAA family ATPase [Bacteroidales bacterium]|nr:AAA family ATPase [Bacteroidales bacterium]
MTDKVKLDSLINDNPNLKGLIEDFEAEPVKKDILGSMERILKEAYCETCSDLCRFHHKYRYDDALMKKVEADASFLAEQFRISEKQAVLFTIILDMASGDEVSKSDLPIVLKSNFIHLLSFEKDLVALECALLIKRTGWGKFLIPEEVNDCLEKNRPYVKPDIINLSTRNILSKTKRIFNAMKGTDGKTDLFLHQIDEMILANPHTSIAKTADKCGILSIGAKITEQCADDQITAPSDKDYEHSMNPCERMLFYALCYRYDDLDDDFCGWWDFRDYFSDNQMEYLQDRYKMKELELQKNRVIEYANRDGLKVKDHFKIRDSVKEELLADCGGLHEMTPLSGTMRCEDLIPKTLYYDAAVEKQVGSLAQLLSEERFKQIRTALTEKGMRSGFTCLFYEDPGTGKTETVYQIAKNTGRDIIMADVSKLKSMWVGESEKNMKALFAKYRKATIDTKVTPILLFNEADAIFGIRKSGAEDAVDKMENSIQNIILQEMEDFQGIMIATTNLTQNFDKAFERRFLYKLRFDKPSAETRSRIWQSMLPELSETEVLQLSLDFDFSGGQIENVVRKKAVNDILGEKATTFTDIRSFCEEEILTGSAFKRKIGF